MAVRIWILRLLVIALSSSSLEVAASQSSWTLTPDAVLHPHSPFSVTARAPNQTRRIEFLSSQQKDQWIRAIEFRPSDTRVVQSAFFYVEKTGQWLGGWVDGTDRVIYPDTVAAYFPAGSKIIAEMHYRSANENVRDASQIALYFADRRPLRPLSAMGVLAKVESPAPDSAFRLQREFTVIADSYAFAVRPELDSGGKTVEVTALDPSGVSRLLLAADFHADKQSPYIFAQPFFIPKGSKIIATASFRNTDPRVTENLFKLTVSMYPSDEYRIVEERRPVPRRVAPAKKSVRKPAAASKAPKKPAAKKPATKKP